MTYTFTLQDLKNELDEERREPYVSLVLLTCAQFLILLFVHLWMSATSLSQVRFGTLDITAIARFSYPIYEGQLAIWAAINGRTEVMLQWLTTVWVLLVTFQLSAVISQLERGFFFSQKTWEVRASKCWNGSRHVILTLCMPNCYREL